MQPNGGARIMRVIIPDRSMTTRAREGHAMHDPRQIRVRIGLAALLICAATRARAEITPDAQPVIDRYVRATGGAAALAAEHATRLRYTISAFGLTGSVQSWTRVPDGSASVTTIGPFTLRTGDDGK